MCLCPDLVLTQAGQVHFRLPPNRLILKISVEIGTNVVNVQLDIYDAADILNWQKLQKEDTVAVSSAVVHAMLISGLLATH